MPENTTAPVGPSLAYFLHELGLTTLHDLTKQVAKAIADDKEVYMSPERIQVQATASRVMFQLIDARESVARLKVGY
jgi:hypothetical protein